MKKIIFHPPLIVDIIIITLSILAAIFLVQTKLLEHLIVGLGQFRLLGAFISGIFFTSVFTTVPALITLGEIGILQNPFLVAIIGGLGAVIGDLLIFKFVKDRFSENIKIAFSHYFTNKEIRTFKHPRFLKSLTILLGGIIIASPFPDELAITILGFAKFPTKWIIPFSFIFSSIGIYIAIIATKNLILMG